MEKKKTEVMRISRQQSTVQIMIDQKQQENVEYLNYLHSLINDARCTHEIKSRISMVKAVFNKKKTFHQQIEFKFKEETSEVLHLEHCFVWC